MMWKSYIILISISFIAFVVSKDDEWGFVTVREGAHMFYWLYYTTAKVQFVTERPLVLWLQGGPGASSSGHGNFEEIGPLDVDLKQRNFTWIHEMNVLFVDSPVGSGFSFVDNPKYFTKFNGQIVEDLIKFLRVFFDKHPQFKTVPFHVISESYGGKVAVEFAYNLDKEIKSGTLWCHLKSVVLIDPWISPIDSMLSWPSFLFNTAAIDKKGYAAIMSSTLQTQKAFGQGKFREATNLWAHTENIIKQFTYGIDFYNILKRIPYHRPSVNQISRRNIYTMLDYDIDETKLINLMNGKVKQALNIPKQIVWGSQRSETFNALSGDFLRPVTKLVELLLNETTINVVVLTGQLDLIVATPGTVAWVDRLRWPKQQEFAKADRKAIIVKGIHEGYCKKYDKFSMYWINRAGHMVPADNPAAMGHILRSITNYG